MKGCVRAWPLAVLVAGLCFLSACGSGPRVKTHPDPETRLKAMRKAIESLPDENGGPEARQLKNWEGETDEKANAPSAK